MPAARYWRIVGIETYAGGDLELSELHLYGAADRLDATATLTSTIAPTAGALAALQDDNLATTCRFAGGAVRASGFALMWDFGAGNTADASWVWLGSATAQAVFMAGCTLQYSTDGVQWVWSADFARYAWPGAGAYTVAPTAGDSAFDKVSLLLHGDGADGSTVFTDSSAAPKTVTATGNVKISTAQSKWGGASALFDGADDELTLASHEAFGFGTGDFTWEAWVWRQNADCALFDVRNNGDDVGTLVAYISSTGYLSWFDSSAKNSTTNQIPVDVWTHVAYCREGGTLHMFVDGVLVRSDAKNSDMGSARALRIGRDVVSNADFAGYIDEIRITKGLARYTSDFTPPTEPFPGSVGGEALVSPTLHTADSAVQIAASAPVPPHSTRRTAPLQLARDVEVGGPGTIYGTTKTKGTLNTPTKARVVLLHQRSKLPVRETWSNPVTGAFAFTGIDTAQKFITLAEDANGDYRPVAASQLTPEVLP